MGADASTATSALSPHWAKWIKGISLGVILVSLLVLMRALPLDRLREALEDAIKRWGVWGPLLFGVIYAVAVVFLVPASLLTLAAGAIFGLLPGTVIVSIAATTGAALAFLIARHLARERVQRQVRQSAKLSAVDQAIGAQGWKIVALLRLSPAVPFTLQNYLYGVTAIRFWPCVLTSWLAMLPGSFMFVYLGSLGSQAVAGRETSTGEWILRGVGLLATVIVTVYITRLAKRAMNEKISLPTPAAQSETNIVPLTNTPPESLWGAMMWMIAAAIFLAIAVTAHWQEEPLQSALENLLGLPTK